MSVLLGYVCVCCPCMFACVRVIKNNQTFPQIENTALIKNISKEFKMKIWENLEIFKQNLNTIKYKSLFFIHKILLLFYVEFNYSKIKSKKERTQIKTNDVTHSKY